MPNDEVAHYASEPAQIETTDQLQLTKPSDVSVTDGPADQQRDSFEGPTQSAGILGQLEAERAHD